MANTGDVDSSLRRRVWGGLEVHVAHRGVVVELAGQLKRGRYARRIGGGLHHFTLVDEPDVVAHQCCAPTVMTDAANEAPQRREGFARPESLPSYASAQCLYPMSPLSTSRKFHAGTPPPKSMREPLAGSAAAEECSRTVRRAPETSAASLRVLYSAQPRRGQLGSKRQHPWPLRRQFYASESGQVHA